MRIEVHPKLADFWQIAAPLYETDPVRNTTIIFVVNRELVSPDKGNAEAPISLTIHDGNQLVGAIVRTPPWFALVNGVPLDHVPTAVAAWRDIDPDLAGVMGSRTVAEAFATEWFKATDSQPRVQENLRLYRLDELALPAVSGQARLAVESDIPLLARWQLAFHIEAGVYVHATADEIRTKVERSLALGDGIMLWEVDGTAVSYAAAKSVQIGISSIAPVYTPPEFRQRGYGSAATAAAARWALDAGATNVLLYTDLSNPISNSIYQKIGFRPVDDYVELAFS